MMMSCSVLLRSMRCRKACKKDKAVFNYYFSRWQCLYSEETGIRQLLLFDGPTFQEISGGFQGFYRFWLEQVFFRQLLAISVQHSHIHPQYCKCQKENWSPETAYHLIRDWLQRNTQTISCKALCPCIKTVWPSIRTSTPWCILTSIPLMVIKGL